MDNIMALAKNDKKETGVMTEGQSARESQEIQAALVVAKKFPRDQRVAMDRILSACSRPSLAEHSLYQYSRGGTDITGPSIRLAEAVAQNWGNISFGIRELEQRNGESTVEAFAWDVETNTKQVKVFQVPHIRHTKKGSFKLEDPRDVYENVANQGARRLRACILGIIPTDVIEAAVKQCDETMNANVDVSSETLIKMTDAFGKMGITREMIEKRIQRRLDTITPAQVVNLRKIYVSIEDGMSTPADWFEVQVPQSEQRHGGVEGLASKIAPQEKKEPVQQPAQTNTQQPQQEQASTRRITPVMLMNALGLSGVGSAGANAYLVFQGKIKEGQKIEDLPSVDKAAIVDHPQEFGKAVREWLITNSK